MAMQQAIVVDAISIAALSTTKNKKGERDSRVHQTCKGEQ